MEEEGEGGYQPQPMQHCKHMLCSELKNTAVHHITTETPHTIEILGLQKTEEEGGSSECSYI